MEAVSRVAIVAEELDFYGSGLAQMLNEELGFARVLRASNMGELEVLLASNPGVDLLAIDRGLPGARGAQTVAELRHRLPSLHIAVFSLCVDRTEILATLAAGAHGFIPKNYERDEVLHALRMVVQGAVFVPSCLADQRSGSSPDQAEAILSSLTERQRQVLSLVAEGCANKVIARQLGISPSTVKVHVNGAFRALGVHSRVGAIAALHSRQMMGMSV